jgi:beta-mannosidase
MQVSDRWRAATADDRLRRAYAAPTFDDSEWEPVHVPGNWRSVPAFARSDGPLLYRGWFEAPPPPDGRRSWLTFDGLFYQGDVWLDGGYLGDTEGYFLPHTFEVTEPLAAGSEHLLAVEVTCSPARGSGPRRNLTGAFQAGDHLDPDGNPGGIWAPVRVTETGPVRIASLRLLCREAGPDRAVVALRAVLDSDAPRRVRLVTEIGDHDHAQDQPLAAGVNEVNWTITIERPALWWPRALGDPTLYAVRVAVDLADGGDDAQISDERRLSTGLRSVRLRRWVWSVNGERLYVKGASVGPTRPGPADARPDDVRRAVAAASEVGLDLIRVHAHVARPELYDAADGAGLLVWQDMPLHGPYARGIRRQAVRQAGALVDLLGHHPSVALWCGHDQPSARARGTGQQPGDTLPILLRDFAADQVPSWNRSVLDGSIKRALQRADGSRPVLAQSGVGPHAPTFDGADARLWLGWEHGEVTDLRHLARAVPRLVRFVSAFGAAAAPGDPAAAGVHTETERWPDLDWDGLAAHHHLDVAAFAARVPPSAHDSYDDWSAATQAYQARLLRRTIEELRRLKYRPTGGFVQHRLTDAHPGITPSVLDHRFVPKDGYRALREACRPVIVVADALPPALIGGTPLGLDVHVVSDRREPIDGAEVAATLRWPGGERRWRWEGDVPADACVRVGRIDDTAPLVDGVVVLALDLTLTLPSGDVVTNSDEARLVRPPPDDQA